MQHEILPLRALLALLVVPAFASLLASSASTLPAEHQELTGAKPNYQVLDPSLGALRERFNQDAGHLRVLMLLSPT